MLPCNLKKNLVHYIDDADFETKDFKDWFIPMSTGMSSFQKLLKYHSYKAKECPDADIVLKQTDESGCVLIKLGWFPIGTKPENMLIDCIFSTKTFLGAFLRFYDDLTYGEFFSTFDQTFSDSRIELWAMENGIGIENVHFLFSQIERISRNTHTIGNYMPCFDGEYNSYKGGPSGGYRFFKDCPERLYDGFLNATDSIYIAEGKARYFASLVSSFDSLYIREMFDNSELLKFQFQGKKMKASDILPYASYLATVNELIEKRGRILAKQLRQSTTCRNL